jgi:hypothetical protein
VIEAGTALQIACVPLARMLVTEVQPRYPARVQSYVRLLSDPENADSYPGVISLAPHPDARLAALGYFELLDGHHRYCAAIIAGRSHLLALIHYAPGQCRYIEAETVEVAS